MPKLLLAAAILALPGALTAQTPTDTLPKAVAEQQIAAFNARDLDRFLSFYADDAVAAEFPSGKIFWQGKAAIRAGFAPLFAAKNPLVVRVEPRIVTGTFVADHEHWDAPPGQRNGAVWMYEITGGLIRRFWRVTLP